MNLFQFIQWCFRDGDSGVITVGLGFLFFSGVAMVIKAFRGEE